MVEPPLSSTADADGNPETNPDGTPIFDGNIESVGFSLFQGVKDVKDKIDDANKEEQQGMIDLNQASIDQAVATTSAEKAAAQKEFDAASAEEDTGEQDVASADAGSGSALARGLRWKPISPRCSMSTRA